MTADERERLLDALADEAVAWDRLQEDPENAGLRDEHSHALAQVALWFDDQGFTPVLADRERRRLAARRPPFPQPSVPRAAGPIPPRPCTVCGGQGWTSPAQYEVVFACQPCSGTGYVAACGSCDGDGYRDLPSGNRVDGKTCRGSGRVPGGGRDVG